MYEQLSASIAVNSSFLEMSGRYIVGRLMSLIPE
jgi:hypothetical protein